MIEADNLVRVFKVRGDSWRKRRDLTAVDDVSLGILPGESVGLVGESGSGKTTLSRLLLRLLPPTRGTVRFEGEDVSTMRGERQAAFRRSVQPVFQDPFSSLDPRMKIGRIVAEPLRMTSPMSANERREAVSMALEQVDLEPDVADRYPASFSGGQRQRIAIARALVSRPRLIILDEAVSSQDMSIRAQILNLLKSIQAGGDVSYLFISHDLSTVRFLCDRIYVMYTGSVVESGPTGLVYSEPKHPYTRKLLAAWLPPNPGAAASRDEMPPAVTTYPAPGTGCRFAPRCPLVDDRCRIEAPGLRSIGTSGHRVACHRADDVAPNYEPEQQNEKQ